MHKREVIHFTHKEVTDIISVLEGACDLYDALDRAGFADHMESRTLMRATSARYALDFCREALGESVAER